MGATRALGHVVDPAAEPRPLQGVLQAAIGVRRGYVASDVDEIGRRVGLLRPDRETFRGATLEEALARSLVWLLTNEPGAEAFA